ncbi:hypothetical protein CEXT_466021 [Caerostris extrusa]|uniref:Uncharacterized protein n=1 Tax=Caerostris extrusa TaxID=172846 RepID=A0AAV4XU96_CAEEX|nr:hypothetical protein CEXT_466021 [Caerostris extrusa]
MKVRLLSAGVDPVDFRFRLRDASSIVSKFRNRGVRRRGRRGVDSCRTSEKSAQMHANLKTDSSGIQEKAGGGGGAGKGGWQHRKCNLYV